MVKERKENMAKLNNDPEQFFDIICVFLFDMIVNQDYTLLKREDIKDLLELFEKKGLKVPLKQHYMSLSNQRRVEYKRIKEAFFNPKSPMHTINIISKEDKSIDESNNELNDSDIESNVDLEFYRIKDLVRQVILNMKKAKYNKPGKIITDLHLDKIITKILKEDE